MSVIKMILYALIQLHWPTGERKTRLISIYLKENILVEIKTNIILKGLSYKAEI